MPPAPERPPTPSQAKDSPGDGVCKADEHGFNTQAPRPQLTPPGYRPERTAHRTVGAKSPSGMWVTPTAPAPGGAEAGRAAHVQGDCSFPTFPVCWYRGVAGGLSRRMFEVWVPALPTRGLLLAQPESISLRISGGLQVATCLYAITV